MSKIIFRKLNTSPTQSPNLYSTFKHNYRAILPLFAIVGVSFTAGGYFVDTNEMWKTVKEMNKSLEEKRNIVKEMNKILEEKSKISEERS